MISQVQTNSGMRISVIPGARMLRMVVMMLIEPRIELMPRMWTAKIVKSMPMPICTVSGAYMRPAHAGRAAGHEEREISSVAANGSSQKDQLFRRANAMSGAPIIIGISQFAKPTNAGMIAPNTMISPCMVVIWLKKSGLTNCSPGENSSARITIAIVAADQEHDEAEPQVHRADVLVVGGGDPAHDAAVAAVMVVVAVVVVAVIVVRVAVIVLSTTALMCLSESLLAAGLDFGGLDVRRALLPQELRS